MCQTGQMPSAAVLHSVEATTRIDTSMYPSELMAGAVECGC